MIRIFLILGLVFSLSIISSKQSNAGGLGACCNPNPEAGCCATVNDCIDNISESECEGEESGDYQGNNTSCESICGSPPPSPVGDNFHQVGGSVMGTSNTQMCCSFYSDVCAPCDNPAHGYSYQTPNACDDAKDYENLWIRCKDPKCNRLTKGSYKIELCHLAVTDPSDTYADPVCAGSCTIGIKNGKLQNFCDFNDITDTVLEGELIYLMITPYSPNAPLKAIWTALANCGALAFCGDGIVNGIEECDDGDQTDETNGCDSNCTFTACGNGIVTTGEDCETDDQQDTVECDAGDCTFPLCGDSYLNEAAGETCDEGGETSTCDDDCTAVACGDTNVNEAAGEQCDDGNSDNSDSCLNDCTNATCGDGEVWNTDGGTEECDDGNMDNMDSCLDTCLNATCGDGFTWNTDGGTEQCDDGNMDNTDSCVSCVDAYCGDGFVWIGTEDCETDEDCGPDVMCNLCICESLCGNNTVDLGEQCDGEDDSLCPGDCEPDCYCD